MTKPKFSILIPTRDRPETLVHALATVTSQPGDDFEIVIADNASRPEVKAAADEITRCPVIYRRSDEVLPMTENWLRGLEACSGEYITVLGDDDGLLPSALPLARQFLPDGTAEILTWDPPHYFWPDFIVEETANFFFLTIAAQKQLVPIQSQALLHGYFQSKIDFSRLPMLYNSFVHRSFLDRAEATWGCIIPLPHCPDVYSGLFNLVLTEKVLYSPRPLSMRGSSGRSFGTAAIHPKRGKAVIEKGFQDEGLKQAPGSASRLALHPELQTLEGQQTENFHAQMASLKLRFRDMALPGHRQLRIDIPQLLGQILATINRDPDTYHETLAYVHGLAHKYGLTLDSAKIPPHKPDGDALTTPIPGVYPLGDGLMMVRAQGSPLGISNIDQACRFAESFFPSVL